MFTNPRHTRSIIAIVVGISIVCSIGALLLPYFPTSGRFAIDESTVSAYSALSQSISTIFALILGLIAIIIVMQVESAAYKASETVKSERLRLLTILYDIYAQALLHHYRAEGPRAQSATTEAVVETSVRTTTLSAPRSAAFSVAPALIAELESCLRSTSGYAFLCYAGEKSQKAPKGEPEPWRTFWLLFDEIRNATAPEVARNCARQLIDILLALDTRDLRHVSHILENLEEANQYFATFVEADVFSNVSKKSDVMSRTETEKEIRRIKQSLDSAGQSDPDVDLFVGVFDDDASAVQDALDRGANPKATDTEVLSRYKGRY